MKKKMTAAPLLAALMILGFALNAHAARVDVDFHSYALDDKETAWLKGYDSDGNQLWYYQCGLYPMAQLDQICFLGINNEKVYFLESGDLIALDLNTGYEVLRNTDYKGSTPAKDAFTFSSSGKLYLSGYLGPDLFIMDADGKTLGRVPSLKSGSYWPYRIEFIGSGNTMRISYESDETTLDFDVTDYFNAQ